ncbi:aldose 1-epimerase family protein [Marinitenerispora sediminis]|uniref:Aldose epimerase n=1 Tax=Marinitenerispora sediminis TaxID=1931232 RepID=A0A368T0P7_9ACTN|nr:aldose 1-epimerase family protein [Marinitenerispora sediminis]RCV52993.1 aldose epimerase [Marinitenerispora sediminis]RCV56686.1 aldose epimerase [Marinitenerispora sediminis]RCV61678.1 aldose epimerase [Marinitenerispora sediminis]
MTGRDTEVATDEAAADEIVLTAGEYRAVVDRHGAALQRLRWRDRDLVWGYRRPPGPAAFQGQVLVPWPNRVDHGRYTFDGATHQLEVTEPQRDNAIHGFAHAEAWLPAEIAPSLTRLTHRTPGAPGYPFPVELSVEYELTAASGLTVRIGARNIGSRPAPYGAGSHNYLTVGGPVDEAVLLLPAGERLPVDGRLLPSGPPVPVAGTGYDFGTPRRIGDTVLDTAFTSLRRDYDGRAWTVLSGTGSAVALWADSAFGWLQVFSSDGLADGADRGQLAVEPMTCPPNAFVSGVDLTVLPPGGAVQACYGIRRVDPLTSR